MQQKKREERKEVCASTTASPFIRGSENRSWGLISRKRRSCHPTSRGQRHFWDPGANWGCAGAIVTLSLVSPLCFWNLDVGMQMRERPTRHPPQRINGYRPEKKLNIQLICRLAEVWVIDFSNDL